MQYLFITIVLSLFLPSISYSASVKDFTATYKLYHNELYVGVSSRRLNTEKKVLTFSAKTETAGLAALFFGMKPLNYF